MKVLKNVILIGLVAASQLASAFVVDFNAAADSNYFSGPIASNGFIASSANHQGTFSNFDLVGQTNGSIYYGTWNNEGLTSSAFTLQAADHSLFSLSSFDFDNAYKFLSQSHVIPSQARTSSLTLVGTKADNSQVSTTFSNLADIFNWTTLNVNGDFSGLMSVSFTATGDLSTRALFDNIVVSWDNTAFSFENSVIGLENTVPEPNSLALLGLSMLGLALTRKQKQRV